MMELGCKGEFESVPAYIDNPSVLHVAESRSFSLRAKQIALVYFFMQELVKEENANIHYVKREHQLADLGTTHLNKHHHRYLIKLIIEFKA